MEDKYGVTEEEVDTRGLVLHVGGDILTAIAFIAEEREPERPMTVNLIANVRKRIWSSGSEKCGF